VPPDSRVYGKNAANSISTGYGPDPAGGGAYTIPSLQCSPNHPAVLKGPTSKERWRKRKSVKDGKGKSRKKKKKRKGKSTVSPSLQSYFNHDKLVNKCVSDLNIEELKFSRCSSMISGRLLTSFTFI